MFDRSIKSAFVLLTLSLFIIPPAKRSFRGVYCFQPVSDSKIPRYRDSMILSFRDHYAPNFEKVGDILVSACPYVCVCVCVCVCVYSCSRYRLETSCMDSSWKNS